jgi:hypothetical protein
MTFQFVRSTHDEPSINIPAIGLKLKVPLPGTASTGALEVIETENAPGFGPPLHRHPQTEVFRVLEGRYLFEVQPGDLVTVPGGTAHGFLNIGDQPARQLVMIVPGFDAKEFFTTLGDLMAHGVPEHAMLQAFGDRWQVDFLGPPIQQDVQVRGQ